MRQEVYREMFANEELHWWFAARRTIIGGVLAAYYPHGAGSILEAGCGTGGNLELLSGFGTVHGMELDEEALDMANSRKICPVLRGRLPDNIPFGQLFDLICLFDVLEHIEEEAATLKGIGNKLQTGGGVLLTVPAYKFLWSGHDVSHRHKRRYVRGELLRLVEDAGFRIIHATYFNTLLFPAVGAVRGINNLLGSAGGSDAAMPPLPLNMLLMKIFSIERHLVPRFNLPFGVSILVLAEKE
ncbi:MAG: class I SAM-dependent methyltransferase [Desulfurivibrionaceae bacterium]